MINIPPEMTLAIIIFYQRSKVRISQKMNNV